MTEDLEVLEQAPADGSYSRGVKIMGLGIAATGLLTFAYFSAASHALTPDQYGYVSLLWALLFIVMCVLYRPVEQLLSRSIAEQQARGSGAAPLRKAALIQVSFAALFLVAALMLRGPLQDDLLGGSSDLYWIFVSASLAYAASYFARGYFAGHKWFALYGALVFFEALARLCFPIGVLVGVATGQTAVAAGILAAPLASLLVVPLAIYRHRRSSTAPEAAPVQDAEGGTSDARFAGSVAIVQLSEQTLLNAAVLLVSGASTQGLVFSALLIARAPLQLFQAVQTSLLPHLAGLEATEGSDAFARAIRQTVLAISGFAGAVVLGLLALGPWALETIFDATPGSYDRGLALLGLGMGLHLIAGTLTQAALARQQAHRAAAVWAASAIVFIVWMAVHAVDDALLLTEVGYVIATALLCAGLFWTYRAGGRAARRS